MRTLRRALGAAATAACLTACSAGGTDPVSAPESGPAGRPNPPSVAHDDGFVHAVGTHLLLHNRPWTFTGMNFFAANNSTVCGSAVGTADRVGANLADMGGASKVLRTWFFQNMATTNGVRDWTVFDRTLAAARASGTRVVAVLTNQWGECEGSQVHGPTYKNIAWYRDGYRSVRDDGPSTYRDWVKQVVSRYANDPTIMAWSMVNEAEAGDQIRPPLCSPEAAAVLQAFARDIASVVRSVDGNHLLSVGTIGGGQCGASGEEWQQLLQTPGVTLGEYHDYAEGALPGDVYNGLSRRLAQARAAHRPLFVAESGIDVARAGGPAARARLEQKKVTAQLGAGAVGVLAWGWYDASLPNQPDRYAIYAGDPVLGVLAAAGTPEYRPPGLQVN